MPRIQILLITDTVSVSVKRKIEIIKMIFQIMEHFIFPPPCWKVHIHYFSISVYQSW